MKTVWVVEEVYDYEGTDVDSIWSTEEKARKREEKLRSDDWGADDIWVYEAIVDGDTD